MTDQSDHDRPASLPIDDLEAPAEPAAILAAVRERAGPGGVPLLGGGLALLAALRSAQKGQLRTIPLGLAGGWLLRYGLETRRESDEPITVEPTTEDPGGDEPPSNHGAAGTDRGEPIHVDEPGVAADAGSEIEFSEDEPEEPRPKPDLETEADPRRTTPDEDEAPDVDLSDSATAAEPSEVTGPSPEQSQPTQTDATEPEETPDQDAADEPVDPTEDASEKRIDPDEESPAENDDS